MVLVVAGSSPVAYPKSVIKAFITYLSDIFSGCGVVGNMRALGA